MDSTDFVITELTNAIDSLEKAITFGNDIRSDKFYFKWFIIALHHALYSFMILALRERDGSGIWKKEERDQNGNITIDAKNGAPLLGFESAWKKVLKKLPVMQDKDKERERDSIIYLVSNGFRNSFIHFLPGVIIIPNKEGVAEKICVITAQTIRDIISLNYIVITEDDGARINSLVDRLANLKFR